MENKTNEFTLYTKVVGMVERLTLWLGEDSMYQQQQEAEAYRAAHPNRRARPGAFIACLNERMLEIVHRPARPFSCQGDGLAALVTAALAIADYAYAEIPARAPCEAGELRTAVDRIVESAGAYFEARTVADQMEAVMTCGKALDLFGKVLMMQYGEVADLSVTQLRVLRTYMLVNVARRGRPGAEPEGSANEPRVTSSAARRTNWLDVSDGLPPLGLSGLAAN